MDKASDPTFKQYAAPALTNQYSDPSIGDYAYRTYGAVADSIPRQTTDHPVGDRPTPDNTYLSRSKAKQKSHAHGI